MLEILLVIPEEVGWSLVGMFGSWCGFALYRLIKLFVKMYKERHEEN
jgi:hypothetical protein